MAPEIFVYYQIIGYYFYSFYRNCMRFVGDARLAVSQFSNTKYLNQSYQRIDLKEGKNIS